jgi:ABC-2 type transport system permease protein
MRNIWLVIKQEIRTTLRQRSFWFFSLLMPAILLGIQVYSLIRDDGFQERGSKEQPTAEEAAPAEILRIGLVDEASLVKQIPSAIPPGMFVPFPDEAAARAALAKDEIEQYVHIPADYVATGRVTVYDRNFQIYPSGEHMGIAFQSESEWMLRYLLEANLTGDEVLVAALRNPTPGVLAEHHVVNPSSESDVADEPLARVIASAIPFVYYFIFIVVSGYLLRSVAAEKENRTVEVLLLSLHPRELMMGKMLGLSIVAWAQLLFWLGSGVLIVRLGSNWLNLSGFSFPPGVIVWAMLFLVFGYLLYSAVMAAAGAISPNAREGGKITWLMIVPLMPTLMFSSTFLEEPHSTLSLVLSLVPFSAPSAMVTRLAVADVPLWQPILSLLGLAATSYLMVLLAARFFRAGTLLSQAAFSWRRLATEWRE